MTSSLPPAIARWPRAHPVIFSAGMFGLTGLLGLFIFWDIRGALAGAVYSAVLSYVWVRPGGIGYRIEARQQREFDERGESGIRPAWLIKALVLVLLAAAAAAAAVFIVG